MNSSGSHLKSPKDSWTSQRIQRVREGAGSVHPRQWAGPVEPRGSRKSEAGRSDTAQFALHKRKERKVNLEQKDHVSKMLLRHWSNSERTLNSFAMSSFLGRPHLNKEAKKQTKKKTKKNKPTAVCHWFRSKCISHEGEG